VGVESGQIRQVGAPQRPVAPAGNGSPHIDLTSAGLSGYVERAAQLRAPEHERFTHNPLPIQTGTIPPNIPVNLQPLVLPQHRAAAAGEAAPAERASAPLTQMAPALDVLSELAPNLRPLINRIRQENRMLGARS